MAVGQLLVATQPGRGGYFDRAVVLLIEHQSEATVGVCLNVVSEIPVHNVLADFTELMSPPARVFEGGPSIRTWWLPWVSPHRSPPSGLGAHHRRHRGGRRQLPERAARIVLHATQDLRGLSAWSPGQLEGELIRGSWFRTTVRPEDVFGDPEGLWRRVLRRMGERPDGGRPGPSSPSSTDSWLNPTRRTPIGLTSVSERLALV
ncbi:hypothetical protein G7085_00785 [Tessaracoccus sp. HDW20]|uniref:YqgE/AlgH family protein n=1 Tax=Tessaracoccus coleopterorum TaxID=2714950 RepID=UPI0018D3ECE8|nr:YqgE/AlgH family protein [Tessaracoccus coleopterorum]NHB83729.1 hypothetical protein [Tessaracoccus coleopterorum]